MMTTIQNDVIQYVKYALGSKALPQRLQNLTVQEKQDVIDYAGKQGLLPFLQYFDLFLASDCYEMFFKKLAGCYGNDSQLTEEIHRLLDAFEEAGIFAIPLKGIRTKTYYPSPELRTMGDLDILYKDTQTKQLQAVMEKLGYRFGGEGAKHDHYDKDGMVIEMHKALLPAQSQAYDYFLGIWERAHPAQGRQYIWEMTLEDHYLFTMYHLIEHFIRGGIGIRMVLDIYILSGLKALDRSFVDRELRHLNIDTFEKYIRLLGKYWFFEDAPRTAGNALTDDFKAAGASLNREQAEINDLAEYVVNGGTYGCLANIYKNEAILHKSRLGFLVHTVFPSYETMKTVFPWLKTPVLLPAAWMYRYFNVWTKRRSNISVILNAAKNMQTKDLGERIEFFRKYGL